MRLMFATYLLPTTRDFTLPSHFLPFPCNEFPFPVPKFETYSHSHIIPMGFSSTGIDSHWNKSHSHFHIGSSHTHSLSFPFFNLYGKLGR